MGISLGVVVIWVLCAVLRILGVLLRQVSWSSIRENLRQRLSLSRFELRFALRLAVVMTISCTISYLWEFEHTYWFPLHAFLLDQGLGNTGQGIFQI